MVIELRAARTRRQQAREDQLWHAWHVAALTGRKRLPNFEQMIKRFRRSTGSQPAQTVAEQIGIARQLNEIFRAQFATQEEK